ncbi:MAG: hypothetical protein ACRCZO_02080, partial [Cetobacterium sp.]
GDVGNLFVEIINCLSSQREEILNKMHHFHNEICNRLAIYDSYFNTIFDRLNRQDEIMRDLIEDCTRSSRGMNENFVIIHEVLREHLRERRLMVDLLGGIHHQLSRR